MKKSMKRIIMIMMTIAVLFSLSSIAFASDAGGGATGGGKGSNGAGISPEMGQAKTAFGDIANNLTGLVQFVGYAIAIGILIYLGIKYVSAPANEKADVKASSVKYVIGAIIIVAAVSLFNLFDTFGNGVVNGGGGGDATAGSSVGP